MSQEEVNLEADSRSELLLVGEPIPYVRQRLDAAFRTTLAPDLDDAAGWAGLGEVRGLAVSRGRIIDDTMMARLPALEIIAHFGVGYDNVDAVAAAARGIIVTNTPDVLTDEVADTTIGLLLATLRELPQADRYLRAGQWLKAPYPLTRGTLRGRKVGIVGLGRIGRAVARRLEPFGVPVCYHGRSRQVDVPWRHYPELVRMAEDVDTLICVAPGGASTRHIVGEAVLKALGPNGVVINIGRGSVIDEAALIRALQHGTILSAGLDVFDDEPRVPPELIAMDHVVLLPHVGSASIATREAMGQRQIDNLLGWFAGTGPVSPVPETPWPRA